MEGSDKHSFVFHCVFHKAMLRNASALFVYVFLYFALNLYVCLFFFSFCPELFLSSWLVLQLFILCFSLHTFFCAQCASCQLHYCLRLFIKKKILSKIMISRLMVFKTIFIFLSQFFDTTNHLHISNTLFCFSHCS